MKLSRCFPTALVAVVASAALLASPKLLVLAQPDDTTICSKYTQALFGDNSAESQLALIQTVVNLSVLGDAELGVPGILADEGGLAPFFSGAAGATANRGNNPVQINFLDGAADLPDNLSPTSNTFTLLDHLYQFFGALLGCTAQGFPAYTGDPDMNRVHKFMFLDQEQLDFFNTQVALAAGALGVTPEDVSVVAQALDGLFNMRCTPPLTAESGVPAFLVGTNPSICVADTCPIADEAFCPEMPTASPTKAPTASPTAAPVNPPTSPPSAAPSTMAPTVNPSCNTPMEEEAMGEDDSICVKYTTAVFGDNTGENQLALMEAVVDLAVLGDAELGVAGILAPEGGLAPFFSGDAGATTNRGNTPTQVNFLDGAGDLPNPSPTSNTFNLFAHLYQFFGALLGCTAEGFPAYTGDPDMYRVHKFMNLNEDQMDFFNSQVALAAQALGVEVTDVVFIRKVLDDVFNMQCTPLVTADSGLPTFMVGTNPSICTASTCPVADAAACPEMPAQTAVPMASPVPSPTVPPPTSAPFEFGGGIVVEEPVNNGGGGIRGSDDSGAAGAGVGFAAALVLASIVIMI